MRSPAKTIIFLAIICVLAAPFAEAVTVDTSIFRPGAAASTDIVGYIQSLYNIGLTIGGILAVGMIVIGAIFRITSAGSPDRIREGNDMIVSALWGVALLFGSYLILRTVNPQIVTLQLAGGLPLCSALPQAQQQPGKNCIEGQKQSTQTTPPVVCKDIPSKVGSGKTCIPGVGVSTVVNNQRTVEVPKCSTGLLKQLVSQGMGRTSCEQDFAFDTITLDPNDTIWEASYYPPKGKNGPSDAQCVIYAFKSSRAFQKGMNNADLTGLSLCK